MSTKLIRPIITTCLVSSCTFMGKKIVDSFTTKDTIQSRLESQGYRTIFKARRHQFKRWKEAYSYHKEDLVGLIPVGISTNHGAYLLKNWCFHNMKESPLKHDLLAKVVKWCTMTIKGGILDEYKVKAAEDLKAEKEAGWNTIWGFHQEAIKAKGIDSVEKLSGWCFYNLRLPHVSSNNDIVRDALRFCTLEKVPR
ncbi:hypothetical protein HF1_06580 [Mycoplasma haemofelis str. Langford 1]|uniref:Lipoprotein n=2 Tax=Mycoplasma haemofelis TaxID=29501 RepID=F6FIF2_MYCHI|nr:hypothetical protein [Mycoplasma haemofelis]AEG73000.1 hypothetical protein MHF_0730 [Mycoplasma haemofelis Ohio2]CBY92666.1 hypothetical protein HF1_06580 [Mycoplasma haemofelis str. Langford 1]